MTMTPKSNPALFAREVVKASLEFKSMPDAPDEDFYMQNAACFVSIKKEGELRGCIGTLKPAEPNLGKEITRNAQSAAFGDPRFSAVLKEELQDLKFSVDVLSMPEPVQSPDQLNCKEYGVIVSCDYRKGVLLPDLEGVENVDQQLGIACQKAGIDPEDEYSLERFTVSRFDEDWQP